MATILLADDDYATAAKMQAQAEGAGHTVMLVFDGFDAVEQTSAARPDIVLVSVSLPVFNGLEVCERIRQDPDNPKELPIVLVYEKELDPRTVEQSGATACLPKAHEAHTFSDMLVSLLGENANPFAG